MSNFIYEHRKSEQIYASVSEARDSITSNVSPTFEDGEIVVSRYQDGSNIKSILGLCHKDGGKVSWTLFSYDDDLIENLQLEGGEIDLSGYLKKSEFNPYSSSTKSQIDSKVSNEEFTEYKDVIQTELSDKINVETFASYTAKTNTTIQSKANQKYVDETFVTQGSLVMGGEGGEYISLKNKNGEQVSTINVSALAKNGMIKSVKIEGDYLVITWNSDAELEPTYISLKDIFNPEDYYTKNEVDSKVAVIDTYDNYLAKSDIKEDVTYFIEDTKTIVRKGTEYQTASWAKFMPVEEIYMQIVVCDKSDDDKIKVYLGSEIDEMLSVSHLVPIGVVVIPKEHNVYGDGSYGVMSLVSMSYETPDVGNVGKKVGQNTDTDYMLHFGSTDYTSGTSENAYPHLGTMDKAINTTKQGTANTKVHIPNDFQNGVSSISDPYGHYANKTDADRFYGISPYEGAEGSFNEMFLTDSFTLFNGKENTEKILELVTKQSDWQTDEKLVNSNASGYYPTACACWRYHTEGTEQGQWFLPSASEIVYVIARYKRISDTLEYINTKFGGEYTTPIDVDYIYNMWTSSINTKDAMICFGCGTTVFNLTSRSVNSSSSKATDYASQARAFLKLNLED